MDLLDDEARAVTERLADWFRENARELPWRLERTPYRVWLSEIMLQQTQVSVVLDYFARFTARFPTVDALARASEDEVLSLWSGLGYYARGRNLHRAARHVVNELGGEFPRTLDGLLMLPGVGAYTAAAILAFGFDDESVLVDGNVARVVARLFDVEDPVDGAVGKRAVTDGAALLVAHAREKALHNEAMMELGALVCTPRSPACDTCPAREPCRARRRGVVHERPQKAPRRERKTLHVVSAVVVSDDAVLLVRREGRGLFGGTYAPPSLERDVDESPARALARLVEALPLSPPMRVPRRGLDAPITVSRTLTHRTLALEVYRLEHPLVVEDARVRAVPFAELAGVGMSSAARAVLAAAVPGIGHFFGANRRRG